MDCMYKTAEAHRLPCDDAGDMLQITGELVSCYIEPGTGMRVYGCQDSRTAPVSWLRLTPEQAGVVGTGELEYTISIRRKE